MLVIGAAIVGDSVGYEVGRVFGPRLLRTRLLAKHSARLEGAQQFLRRRGAWPVVIGRFTAFLRAVTPGLAGLSGMPYRRFLVFTALGGLVWGGGCTLIGYAAGESYARVEKPLGRATAVLTAVVGATIVVLVLRTRYRRTGEDTTTAAPA